MQLAADGTKIENGRVGVRWGLSDGNLRGRGSLRNAGYRTIERLSVENVSQSLRLVDSSSHQLVRVKMRVKSENLTQEMAYMLWFMA